MYLLLSTVGSNAIFNNAGGDSVQDKGKEPVAKLLTSAATAFRTRASRACLA